MSDDRAPRWLIRWIWTAILLVVLAVIVYADYTVATYSDTVARHMHGYSCDFAKSALTYARTSFAVDRLGRTMVMVCNGPD